MQQNKLAQFFRFCNENSTDKSQLVFALSKNLKESAHYWQLPRGGKIFAYPQQFAAVQAFLAHYQLRPHHVIAARAFEPLVQ